MVEGKQVRIALSCRAYVTNSHGGMENVCADRAEELARQGHDVHVVTGGEPQVTEHNGVAVHQVGGKPYPYTDELAAGSVAACEALRPEILHLDSFDCMRPWWRDRPGKPRVVATTYHGGGWGKVLTDWNAFRVGMGGPPTIKADHLLAQARCVATTFDRVIAIGHWEQLLLRTTMHRLDARLVYNPIAPCFFEGPFCEPGDSVLMVTRDKVRGYEIAQAAAAKAHVHLEVAEGYTREQMPAVFDGCKALILPTLRADGFDLTVAEALARRRPVLASGTGSYLMERCDGYHIVPVWHVDALAARMRQDLPEVSPYAADRHRPKNHVFDWLEALG